MAPMGLDSRLVFAGGGIAWELPRVHRAVAPGRRQLAWLQCWHCRGSPQTFPGDQQPAGEPHGAVARQELDLFPPWPNG